MPTISGTPISVTIGSIHRHRVDANTNRPTPSALVADPTGLAASTKLNPTAAWPGAVSAGLCALSGVEFCQSRRGAIDSRYRYHKRYYHSLPNAVQAGPSHAPSALLLTGVVTKTVNNTNAAVAATMAEIRLTATLLMTFPSVSCFV
jgi:hypothetical protein